MKRVIYFFCLCLLSPVSAEMVFGPSVPMGAGSARAFVEMNGDQPDSIGLTFDDGALAELPEQSKEFLLELPKKIAPFDHLGINWQPVGHKPESLQVPHFDIHFYFINEQDQHAISCRGDDAEVCAKPPAEGLLPEHHFVGSKVPKMGAHWYDKENPAFCGQPFTATMVYGFYDAHLIFLEPMVTRELLQSRANFPGAIPQPSRFERAGAYPTSYVVDFDPSQNVHRVYLTGIQH